MAETQREKSKSAYNVALQAWKEKDKITNISSLKAVHEQMQFHREILTNHLIGRTPQSNLIQATNNRDEEHWGELDDERRNRGQHETQSIEGCLTSVFFIIFISIRVCLHSGYFADEGSH